MPRQLLCVNAIFCINRFNHIEWPNGATCQAIRISMTKSTSPEKCFSEQLREVPRTVARTNSQSFPQGKGSANPSAGDLFESASIPACRKLSQILRRGFQGSRVSHFSLTPFPPQQAADFLTRAVAASEKAPQGRVAFTKVTMHHIGKGVHPKGPWS